MMLFLPYPGYTAIRSPASGRDDSPTRLAYLSTSLRGLTAAVLIFVTINLVIPTYHELAKPFPRGHAGHAGSVL